MNNNQTVEKLRELRLNAMANLHVEHVKSNRLQSHTPDEYLTLLTEHQWEERQNKKIERLLKLAAFKQNATSTSIDYRSNRNLDKNMFERLLTLDFITRNENIIFNGPSGVGKSYLAQVIGHQACMMQLKTIYTNTARLFKKLKISKVDGTYLKELHKLQKAKVLILDDFGLQSMDNHDREALMDIIEDRYNKNTTIIASQIPVSTWYDIIGEGTIADAILDRIVNASHRVKLNGESLRKGKLKI